MSFLSNLFGGADNAAQAQIQGIQAGLGSATGNINQGNQDLTTNYGAALAPFTSNFNTAQQGTGALGNLLGLNGAQGTQSALTSLKTTPGYQFQLGQGDNAINAQAAAGGTLGSGNQATALSQFNQGLAGTTYNNAVSQLSPYLGYSTQGASGISGVDTGLGSSLNQNQNTLANLNYGAQTSMGNATASADLADQSMGQNLLSAGLKLGTQALAFSDARLKDGIEPIGELFDGTNIYRYKYIDDPTRTHIGVMAQEVERTNPDAVRDLGGFLAVDYAKVTDAASDLGRFLDAA